LRCAVIGTVLLSAAIACGSDTRYVAERDVVLTYATANDAPVERVDVWLTRDGGKSWNRAPVEQCGRLSVCFHAPEDGWYGFYLVLHNSAGASADPPAAGAEPHSQVIVDTVAPALQVHRGIEPVHVVPGQPLNLRLSLIDEHLGSRPVRVFYRAGCDAAWADGGPANLDGLELTWPAPVELADSADLRIVATDLAGNRAFEDVPNLPVDVPTSLPVADAPVANLPPDSQPTTSPAAPPAEAVARRYAFGELDRLKELRRLAARQSAAGHFPQAAETLEQAVQICPDDPDLLSGLGEALYSAGRQGEAERWFSAAAAASPDHPRALEGLALVAATQKRYSQAAAHLEHLLRIEPESAQTWLHYGDVEHKLGETSNALEAWERVVSLRDADPAVRESAERRLKYFGPPRVRP
jgi:Flp pilus assembly protein TadD